MSNRFLKELQRRVVVFDGAMGTSIQNRHLSADDFWGKEGCNELLVLSCPDVIRDIHASFLEVGCQVVETDTFGATPLVLAEYDLADKTYEINRRAAELAREVASDYNTPDRPRFVAGSMGPGTRLPSLGHISYDELRAHFREQVRGLMDGGADLLIVETCQDILQTKAALGAIFQEFSHRGREIPVIVSLTIETTGTMLVGTEPLAALTALEPFPLTAIGLNCATGPEMMSDHIRTLAAHSRLPVSCIPNAGLPENVGGKAVYRLQPEKMATHLKHFVEELGVQIVGGCCGTTPEHLRAVVEAVGEQAPRPRIPEWTPAASSLYTAIPLSINPPPVLIGERCNANGSKKFRQLLLAEDWEGMVQMAREQERGGSHMLDICVAYVGRDEKRDMREFLTRLRTAVKTPLMIDSTEVPVIEEALKLCGGRCIINSINLEDGEEKAGRILALCREYGAAVVALTIDEEGMAKTAERKVAIARRIYRLATERYDLRPEDLLFDPLTFTLGSGDEEFRRAGIETLQAIRRIKEELPGVKTMLGVSNISFGLAPAARHTLNSVFLHEAVQHGLDAAIVHASKIKPLYQIDEQVRQLCLDLIYDRRVFEEVEGGRRCTYDPLTELMAYFDTHRPDVSREASDFEQLSVEERLKRRIIDGNRIGLEKDLEEALEQYPPLEIINTILLEGMKVVGDLFGAGEMQLPFVLQSAEVMKAAVAYLEPHMERVEGQTKGTMVLATVKGDVHDIGKNLVDIILTNNGYTVINLGIKQPIDNILAAAREHAADAVGMSGLLVKSTAIMKENLEVMNERGIHMPVILGGAALNRRFVEEDLRTIYRGEVYYAQDAFEGLRLMDQLCGHAATEVPEERRTAEIRPEVKVRKAVLPGALRQKARARREREEVIRRDVPVPVPPFLGTEQVDFVDPATFFPYLNRNALYKGQWQIKQGNRTQKEYETFLREEIDPVLNRLIMEARQKRLLEPRVVYGFYPVQSEGNRLYVYRLKGMADAEALDPNNWPAFAELTPDDLEVWQVFDFPRQTKGNRRCISDFFRSVESGELDVLGVQLVTVGEKASVHAQALFEANRYQEYLYFHGFSVEMAEALAEYWHKRMRELLDIDEDDAPEIEKLFSQGYRGSRYSFGYPACPNLEDHRQLFAIMRPERIGVRLTEEWQLVPEQSTSAIVVHHPQARYFNV